MDASFLTTAAFWKDPAPFPASDLPELTGHVCFQTSGSSGPAKWVALSKQALLFSAAAVNEHLRVTQKSRWGLALPLHHVGGFGIATRAYQAGCYLGNFGQRWEPAAFHHWLSTTGITHTALVPTQIHDLVRAQHRAPSGLSAIVVGGGHLDVRTGQAARDLGWPVLASYGMTEAGSQIATQGRELLDAPYHAAPIPLLPIWEARLDPDQRLVISGAALFSGYVSEGKFIPRPGEWHLTSDRVSLADKAISPLGRVDAQVKILGELVDPEAIERELTARTQGGLSLDNFALIPLPNERAGNALIAVFEAPASAERIERLLRLDAETSPRFRQIQGSIVFEKFPRSELGKLQRGELAKWVANSQP